MSIRPQLPPQKDKEIIALICAKNEEAYAMLYDKYSDKMLGFAYSFLKNVTDAEDLVHDVFIEVWNKAHTYNVSRGSVISWLMLRVRSRCLDRFRQRKAIQKNTQIQVVEDFQDDYNLKIYNNNQQQTSIHKALELLSEKQRNVVEMSYFKGLTCAEISQYYDIPLGTVKTRLMSAINILRNKIDNQGTHI